MNQISDKPEFLEFIVNGYCNVKDAYYFNKNNTKSRIGHLLSLSFPEVRKTLVSDIFVCDLENPRTKKNVIAIFSHIRWCGSTEDPIIMILRVSHTNKAIMQEALCLLGKSNVVKLEWIIYEFDPHGKKYFKRMYTCEKPLICILTEVDVEEESYKPNDIKELNTYVVKLALMPKTYCEQKIGFAFNATGTQFIRLIGGKQIT